MGAFDAIRRYADEHGCLEAALLEAVLAELGASTLEVQTTIAAVVRPNKMVAVDDLEAWLDGRNVSLRQACPCLPADVDPNDPFSVAAASQFSSGAPGTAAADVVTRGLTLAPSVRGGSGAVIVPLGKGAKLPMAEAGIAARTPADGGERFVEADMPPSTPESTFFKLMASSLRTSGAAPFELANLMLDFLHSEVVASVSKVRLWVHL